MATAVVMPKQGQSVESCVLVEWLVKRGDKIAVGAPLASIETDKAVFEVESPAAGTILDLFFQAGADIPVLTNIAAIGEPGEDVSALRGGAAAEAGGAPAGEPKPAAAAAEPSIAAAPPAVPAVETVGVSPRARKLAEQTGVNAAALAGSGPGGRVIERDVQSAADAGTRLSPAARAAVAAGVGAAPCRGSGPAGMVLASDVRPGAATPAPAPAPAAAAAQLPAVAKEVPFSGIRKIIADRMRKSLATTAQLSMHSTADASAMLAFRERIKCSGEALGLPNITLNDIVLFAVARTLARFPDLNAHCVGEKVVLLPEVNLGVAMETPRGLMVPVLRGANRLSLPEISRQVKPMTDAARKGAISPDLLTGGTFTVTNMGMLGVESFTPILNVPEVAILGVGGLTLRAVGTPHAVRYVQTIGLSLTVDHQAVDGAPGARFLKALAEALENFDLILAAEGRGA